MEQPCWTIMRYFVLISQRNRLSIYRGIHGSTGFNTTYQWQSRALAKSLTKDTPGCFFNFSDENNLPIVYLIRIFSTNQSIMDRSLYYHKSNILPRYSNWLAQKYLGSCWIEFNMFCVIFVHIATNRSIWSGTMWWSPDCVQSINQVITFTTSCAQKTFMNITSFNYINYMLGAHPCPGSHSVKKYYILMYVGQLYI